MNLSEFINYRNKLESMQVATVSALSNIELQKILLAVKDCPVPIAAQLLKLDAHRQNLDKEYQALESILNRIKGIINAVIESQGESWILESQKRYQFELDHTPIDSFLTKKTAIPDADRDFYIARLNTYASWQQPGVLLRPAQNEFIHSMVCFDPLYIGDKHDDLLWPCQLNFPDQYRKRLRPFIYNENESESLAYLPDNQFGVGLAFDYFNFLPMHVIVFFLEQMFKKLKPGGIFCFTINDCDTEKGMKLVENFQTSYVPRRAINQHIERIGYQKIFEHNNDSPLTWIEVRKPGDLTSIKGGQVLAAVRPKPKQN